MKETMFIDEVKILKNKIEAAKYGCKIIDMEKYERRNNTQNNIELFKYIVAFIIGLAYGLIVMASSLGAL